MSSLMIKSNKPVRPFNNPYINFLSKVIIKIRVSWNNNWLSVDSISKDLLIVDYHDNSLKKYRINHCFFRKCLKS